MATKRIRRNESVEVNPDFLNWLEWKDQIDGIRDPHQRKIAEANGILKWTPFHERWAKQTGRERPEVIRPFNG